MAKISVSLEDDLYQRVREAAGPSGVSGSPRAAAVSCWHGAPPAT
ncbi:MAG: hypothetical protein ACYDHN_05015 [Solirubrobacteraceae bacterium]